MDFIITSEHRVGSRWMHYLLADLLSKSVSPELDVTRLTRDNKLIKQRLLANKIVKFHRAVPTTIFTKLIGDYKILGVVRNPRDRGVSLCFHNRYHERNPQNFKESKFGNDDEAMAYTIMRSGTFTEGNKRQLKYMLDGYSTRNRYATALPYIWTSYEWLKEDTLSEVRAILDFLEVDIADSRVKHFVDKHSFKKKAGRPVGKEERENNWRRKGINNDWQNWFTPKMVEHTEYEQERYWEILNRNDYSREN